MDYRAPAKVVSTGYHHVGAGGTNPFCPLALAGGSRYAEITALIAPRWMDRLQRAAFRSPTRPHRIDLE